MFNTRISNFLATIGTVANLLSFFRTTCFASVLVSQVWLFASYFQLERRRARDSEQPNETSDDFEDDSKIETRPKRTPRSNLFHFCPVSIMVFQFIS